MTRYAPARARERTTDPSTPRDGAGDGHRTETAAKRPLKAAVGDGHGQERPRSDP